MSARHDLIIDQGADFAVEVDLFDDNGDPDLTAYVATAMFRKNYTSSNSYPFECVVPGDGTLVIQLSSVASANIVAGRYVYDVDLYDPSSNTTSRILEGQITLTPSVTR